MHSLVYNFYLSVAARKIVSADPSLRYTRMLLGRYKQLLLFLLLLLSLLRQLFLLLCLTVTSASAVDAAVATCSKTTATETRA